MVNSEATRRSLPAGVRGRARWVVYTPSGVGGSGTVPARSFDVLRPLYLGRIAQWKGPELFIEACELVARRDGDAIQQATMAGGSFFHEEDYRRHVVRLAAAAYTPIEVLDHQDDLDALFDRANVLVHTSTSPEPFGQVIVQAMARGLLVVAPNAGGPAEMIADGENGFLHQMGDAASLADSLLAVRQNPGRAEEVARRGSVAVARFADDAVTALINRALAEFAGVGLQPA
jgi:glycosyltransferase involved in cell wall biosynthesis